MQTDKEKLDRIRRIISATKAWYKFMSKERVNTTAMVIIRRIVRERT